MGFIAFKMNIILRNKRTIDTDVVGDFTDAKVLLYVWSYDFYDMPLFTEKQRRQMKTSNIQFAFRFSTQMDTKNKCLFYHTVV